MELPVPVDRERIAAFCRAHSIRRLALFGSVPREDFGPESDVDVLVDFEPGRGPGYFGIFDMEEELSENFGGRKVDLRTRGDSSRYFRDEVVSNALVLHDAA